jgi:taurine dioxygenase
MGMTTNYKHIEIDRATPTIGAYVSGVDLNHVDSDAVYDEIKQALWQHGVLFFRKQALNPESYIRLGNVFGDVEKHEFFPHMAGFPQIQLVAHEGTDTPETDRWHADVTFRPRPSLVSILRITDLPPSGGDTMWMSAAAAFEALGPQMQQMLLGLRAEHDMPWQFRSSNVYDKLIRKQLLAKVKQGLAQMPTDQEIQAMAKAAEHKMIDDNPSVVHPAVITHPHNGRKVLYVNSIWTKCFKDLHLDISDALLHTLAEWVKKPEFMVRFRWEPDSLVMWDNCATQHYAVFDYAPHYRAGQRMTCGNFLPALV